MGLSQTYVVQIQTVKSGFYYITLLKRRVMAIKIEDSLQTQDPFKLVIYGDNGTGKSSLMEKHGLFYNYEDGIRYLNCKQVRLVGEPLEATTEASQYIFKNAKELLKQHSCLVIDSLDFLEKTIIDSVCKEKNVSSIGDIKWGAGYQMVSNKWREFLNSMDHLRKAGFNIVFICHAQIVKINNPNLEEYDMWNLKLQKNTASYIAEWSDFLGMVCHDVFTVQQQKKFGEMKYKPGTSGRRVIKFGHNPSYASKSRLPLPDEVDLNWEAFLSAVAQARADGNSAKTGNNQQTGNNNE